VGGIGAMDEVFEAGSRAEVNYIGLNQLSNVQKRCDGATEAKC